MTKIQQIFDNHGRPVNYLRLSVTDRCNLRCFYCMPEEGVQYIPRKELLTYEEMLRLAGILGKLGISKVRITGGEPFVRRDLIGFLEKLTGVPGIEKVSITTNGVLTENYLDDLERLGITSVNLSLDTLDRERFLKITRRDEYDRVMSTLDQLIARNFEVKINSVVMKDKNTEDIIPMIEMTKDHPVSMRFIEEMPFNGLGSNYDELEWNHQKILDFVRENYSGLKQLETAPNSTSVNYQVPGYQGNLGIIAAYTRTFCGSCNRIRITAQGTLKTCLYDNGVIDIRQVMRSGGSDDEIKDIFLKAFRNRPKDGFEAESRRSAISESMSTIGG